MKTKLLKKVRKRFEILYYPKGIEVYEIGNSKVFYLDEKFQVVDKKDTFYTRYYNTKNEALDEIIEKCRCLYSKYSTRHKKQQLKNKPVKVWYRK